MFVHCVYFWLRENLGPEEQERFHQGVHSLTKLPSVVSGWAGKPAATDRPVIDRSYSYALVVAFPDEAGHEAYQVHPVHDAFRANCSPLWERVKIYDFQG